MEENGYFVRPGLLAEIDHKRDVFLNRVSDGNGLLKDMLNAASLDASYHSKITEPDHASRSKKVGRRRDFRETKGNLDEARRFSDSSFGGVVTKEFLLGLVGKIDPKVSPFYRLETAMISGYGDLAVSPGKIKEEMDSLMEITNNTSLHPVDRAVLFHLHCLRIHPFTDGNGRTSRFVQNMLLTNNGYAPAILPPAERTFYNDLIHDARANFRERGSEGIRPPELMRTPPSPKDPEGKFLHYMATKINVGMDKMIGDYEDLPHYEVVFSSVKDPGQVMRVKKSLAGYLKSLGKIAHLSVKNKTGRIEVRADINDNCLVSFLDKNARLRYKITRYD